MISVSLIVILCIITAILAYQDLKSREVHLFLIVLLFIFSFSLVSVEVDVLSALINYGKSAVIIGMVCIMLYIYSKLRFGNQKDFLSEVFAIGDILFLVSIGGLFKSMGICVVILLSSVSAIVSSLMLKLLKTSHSNSIPFITYSGIVLIFLLATRLVDNDNFQYLSDVIFYLNKL